VSPVVGQELVGPVQQQGSSQRIGEDLRRAVDHEVGGAGSHGGERSLAWLVVLLHATNDNLSAVRRDTTVTRYATAAVATWSPELQPRARSERARPTRCTTAAQRWPIDRPPHAHPDRGPGLRPAVRRPPSPTASTPAPASDSRRAGRSGRAQRAGNGGGSTVVRVDGAGLHPHDELGLEACLSVASTLMLTSTRRRCDDDLSTQTGSPWSPERSGQAKRDRPDRLFQEARWTRAGVVPAQVHVLHC
jgi:hypothetical protein